MHTKVFVGNLSFKTKADELAAEFSAAGRVVSANIITRGPRSLGYGFVELESEEEASKAVALLNKRSVDGREINVELAKPRDETKITERRQGRGGGGGGGDRGDRGGERGGMGGDRGGGRGGLRRGGGGGRGGGRGRGGAPPGSDNNAPLPAHGDNNAPPSDSGRGGFRPRRYRPRGPPGGGPPHSNAPGGEGIQHRERRPRGPPRGPPRPDNRTPSSTTLFVANLPFAMEDAGLSGLFKDLKVSKAHVVKNRNGRSKGFGFVEFENEADQKAALTASEKLVVDNRPLSVKIALTAPDIPKDAAAAPAPAAAAAPAPAPTPASPAPADAPKEAPKADATPKSS